MNAEFSKDRNAVKVIADAPDYMPESWNGEHCNNNLAYTYALNVLCHSKDKGWFMPGERTGQKIPFDALTSSWGMRHALLGDGLIECPSGFDPHVYSSIPQKCHVIAAYVTESKKLFHFFRQDSDGGWSHKFGSSNVTMLDAGGREIIDPRTACRYYSHVERGVTTTSFDQLVGFFFVPNGLV